MSTPTVHLAAPATAPDDNVGPEPAALATVAAHLRLTVGAEILDGGSAARVYRAHDEDGDPLAVKVLVTRPGLVDGHDIGSFLAKLTQLAWIRAGEPALAARYLPVRHAVHGAGWAAYTTPFYESVDSAAPLREPDGGPAFFAQHRRLVADLIVHGYGQAVAPAAPDYLATVVAGRLPRRLPLLERGLPADLLRADQLIINGTPCVSPLRLLDEIIAAPPAWWNGLAPPRLMFPAHGDANTRNVLVGEDGFRIIDPRGSTAYADPVYDLAKTLFSLTVWDPALRLGCRCRRADDRADRWEVGFRSPAYPGYRLAAHGFLAHLDGLAGLTGLLSRDPHWRERLLLTHALHVLSEAACRLSDSKIRHDPDGTECTPADLALAHYLFGTLLLNDLVRQLAAGGPDVDRHLGLVTGPGPRTGKAR